MKILKITKDFNQSSSSSIFDITNEYVKNIPIIRNCLINPLKVDIVFQNDTGITFFNKNAFDLDITCYIDDEIEKNKKVGYGNSFKKTKYISWGGDETNGGLESIKVDINKYIKDKFLNEDKNTSIKIIFNICWHKNSEITTSNVYALVTWNNLIEKYPINIFGLNSLSCNTRSFIIEINMKTYELFL